MEDIKYQLPIIIQLFCLTCTDLRRLLYKPSCKECEIDKKGVIAMIHGHVSQDVFFLYEQI